MPDLLLPVPYYSQRDSQVPGQAPRSCFSSSCAMLLEALKPGTLSGANGDDRYLRDVLQRGDTTDAGAQVATLASYGVEARFSTQLDWPDVDRQLARGIPVPIGILHHGPVSAPSGGGHWIIIIGRSADGSVYTVHDPWGEMDLLAGVYLHTDGRVRRYSRRNLTPRWRVGGSGGWGIIAEPVAKPAPKPAPPDLDYLKIYRKPTAMAVLHHGQPCPAGRLEIEWGPGTLSCRLDGRPIPPETLTVELGYRARPAGETVSALEPVRARFVDMTPMTQEERDRALAATVYGLGPDDMIAVAIGVAEGTRTPDGGKTPAYYGHQDPGNDRRNLGTFSFQGEASSPEDADRIWLERMRTTLLPAYLQACALGHLDPGTPLLAAAVCDLYTQSPAACTAPGGLLEQIARGEVRPDLEGLIEARCRAYVDPGSGELDAPGFGNDAARLRADQTRRMRALAAVLQKL